MMGRRSTGDRVFLVVAVTSLLVAALVAPMYPQGATVPSPEGIAEGEALYQKFCAACHGVNLEGQPNWKTPRPSGTLPAPPHDASGHTWHHPTSLLFKITKKGASAVVGGGYKSDMGGFERILSDDQINDILEFIKSTWPERERNYHEEMNRRELERGNKQ
jgi:mono/diheme cytochrome c family protein